MIPYPFSRGVYVWGDPVVVGPDADEVERERCREDLERSMRAAADRADRYWVRP